MMIRSSFLFSLLLKTFLLLFDHSNTPSISFLSRKHIPFPSVPSLFFKKKSDMDGTSYQNFVDLLQSQEDTSFGFQSSGTHLSRTQAHEVTNLEEDTPPGHKEKRAWTPSDAVVLISSWLNTSKDPVVRNEQKSVAFWSRIAAYYAASPKVAGTETRE